MSTIASPPGVQILGPIRPGYERVLTHEALSFVAALARQFTARIEESLEARVARQLRFDRGELPDFLEETASVREGDWKVAPLPADILDRRVEISVIKNDERCVATKFHTHSLNRPSGLSE